MSEFSVLNLKMAVKRNIPNAGEDTFLVAGSWWLPPVARSSWKWRVFASDQ
jgi:hypothetical protein